MGLFNLERSHCQDQAEYDTSDSGQHSLVLFFTLSPVAVTVLPPPLFLSLTLSPLIFCCLSSLFSSSLDLSLRKVFETHCGRVFNHIFVHISVEAILVLCITIQYFVLLRFFGICSFSSLGNLNQLKTI